MPCACWSETLVEPRNKSAVHGLGQNDNTGDGIQSPPLAYKNFRQKKGEMSG